MNSASCLCSTILTTVLTLLFIGSAQPLPLTGHVPAVLSFGVGNNALDDISRLGGMPVAYRYQYLTGGLDYPNDWRHWNSPDGAFVDLWLAESKAAGLMPVLTYYEIVPAQPNAYQEPPLANLATAATMAKYFANWVFLMQKIAAFNEPVIVHVEPDMFGFIQQNSSNPASTYVAVAASGFAGVQGYENNARGFAQALVALRDQYAPKVILGWHASAWATRVDLILNEGDPVTLATATANFYKALNAPFDVTFAEFSDRDAGYYQTIGQPQRWWEASDFDRFRQFLASLSAQVNQKIILWQVPMGNTLYRACNNTPYHYQDNRPEYFLKSVIDSGATTRLREYRDAGVIAILFGAGQDEQTKYYDSNNDGVVNPNPIDNRALNGNPQLNERLSLNADDDGGFLRLGIGAYYANGPLPWADAPAVLFSDGFE